MMNHTYNSRLPALTVMVMQGQSSLLSAGTVPAASSLSVREALPPLPAHALMMKTPSIATHRWAPRLTHVARLLIYLPLYLQVLIKPIYLIAPKKAETQLFQLQAFL